MKTQMGAAVISTSKFPNNQPQLNLDLPTDSCQTTADVMVPKLPDADVRYFPNFLTADQANKCFEKLLKEVPFSSASIHIYGQEKQIPRLQSWHGDYGLAYTYSGKTLHALAWTEELKSLKDKIETRLEQKFNAVLCNLYRDGNDSMGWHSDDETELGPQPVIASLSLGEIRPFKMRHKKDKALKWQQMLGHGSLLVMAGHTQRFWQHHIPKTQKPINPRLNLTFRWIHSLPDG